MRMMSGYSSGSGRTSQISNVTDKYANDLNIFYNRFDNHDFTEEVLNLKNI